MTGKALTLPFGGLRARAQDWTRVLVEFAVAQGFAQAAGMLSGLLFVRVMSTEQYAFYALATMALSVVTVGSDLGLVGSLGYFWRRHLNDKAGIARKIGTLMKLRSILFCVSLTVGAALLLSSPVAGLISGPDLLLALLLIATTGWMSFANVVGSHLLRLSGRQRASYLTEAAGNAVRLAAALIMFASGLGLVSLALAAGLLGAGAIWLALRMVEGVPVTQKPVDGDWQELRHYLLPVMPGVLVYMVQDPLVLWLTAQRVGPTIVAEAFALARIGAIFGLAGTFTYMVLTPRLSGVGDPSAFLRTLCAYAFGLGSVCCLTVAVVYLMPEVPLWLIGPRYGHLGREVVVCVAAVAIVALATLLQVANRLRGWVRLDPVLACTQLALILGLCAGWTFRVTMDVVSLNLAIALGTLASAVLTLILGVTRPEFVAAGDAIPASTTATPHDKS